MSRNTNFGEDKIDLQIQQNVTNWQSNTKPLAPLLDEQLDIIYYVGDLLKNQTQEPLAEEKHTEVSFVDTIPEIDTNRAYIKWMVSSENEIKYENLKEFQTYYETLCDQSSKCEKLFKCADETSNLLQDLQNKYLQVTAKTDSLHSLSEQLMTHQRILKEKKKSLNEKLHYFLVFKSTQDNIERFSNKINSQDFIELLNNIDSAIKYLGDHMNFKESRIYRMKYESLLVNALNKIYKFISNVIIEAMKQVLDPDLKTNIVPLNTNATETTMDTAFSLYYGKFQSAASKVKQILSHLEEKSSNNEQYHTLVSDCQKFYISQRLPVLSTAVSKALAELKDKYKNDYSILFRSCGLFIMKTCQDEAYCYHYFFAQYSNELDDYLGVLCQQLYDTLRPSLIIINHVEVLSELCGILQKEMLVEKTLNNDHLSKYVETVKQLLQDVEERLVFRTNIFFQHDLLGYNPSPGDLAYPEKLEHMENIASELQEMRTDSRSSVASLESQEVAAINSSTSLSSFRSYTGNSPADLHGMWYPTVKRTLVILSRLYFCLDRETFQGLAQEALLICIETVQHAARLISTRKTEIDGRLFQIKHLLIIREQIAPFQVDFTVKEFGLDFSSVQKAAVELLNHRDRLFTFGSNNALLEFLLDGTPRVKEYLVDSRKEIDKQLKQACEAFINCATNVLTGSVLQWKKRVELFLQDNSENRPSLPQQKFGSAKFVADLIVESMKNMKTKVPEIQRSMQLYLANRETEFILFRPVKNNVINVFVQVEQILSSNGYSTEEMLLIGCPSPEQVNVLICSVSLTTDYEFNVGRQ